MDDRTVARFWSHVDKNGPVHSVLGTRCWLWTAFIDKDGYGKFSITECKAKYRQVVAHRFAWYIEHGRWPEPQGLHKCDNPSCCNPAHVFEGTPLDNMQDKVAKGRHRHGVVHLNGELHGNAILTDVLVQQIRQEYVPRKVTLAQLASKYGVALSTVHYVIHDGWRHL